jgi:eukaryotic-like serine/threonine-protein kinase
MGFLKMDRVNIIYLLIILTAVGGCNRLSLRQSLNRSKDDIPMYGYSPARNNLSLSAIRPPLDSMWSVDLGAGTSIYSPAVVDNLLFIGNLRGEIQVVHVSDGKVYGKKKLGTAVVGTPVVEGDVVYVALTNSKRDVVAYNFLKAGELWDVKTGDIESSPLLLGSKLYVGTLSGEIYCVDAKTGNIDWKYSASTATKKRLIRSSPATDGANIVFCCDEGTVICMRKDGTVAWKFKTGGSVVASPAILGEQMYICSADSNVYSLSISTGLLIWRKKLSAAIYSSPAVSENFAVVGCANGAVWCFNRQNGERYWIREIGGVIASAPVISGSLVYVGNLSGELFTLSMGNGEVIDERVCNGRIKTSPLVYKQFLILIVESRSLVGFQGSYQ